MQINIKYGKEEKKLEISEKCKVLLPKKIKIKDEESVIKKALSNPIKNESFDKFVEKSNKLLVIVNDATKPTPTSKILEHIYPILSKHSDIKYLIATGTHKAPDEEQCRYIFGRFYDILKENIYINDSKNKKNFDYIGETKKKTKVYINKLVKDAENIIVIGSVEPHYFAGYTGGRKSFVPGVASYETIEMNHKFALDDKAVSLNLDSNPLHQDLIDALSLLKDLNIFSIQCVLNNDYDIYSVKCGDIIKTFEESIDFANDVYCSPIKEKANIILTVVPYPMDINLYQSQHSLENAKLAVEDGGVIILVSKCRKGTGNDAFINLLSNSKTVEDVLKPFEGQYRLGSHKSVRILKIKSKVELFAVTSLDEETIKKAKFKPFKDIKTALDKSIELIKSKGKKPNILIMPYGNLTVPYFRGK
jgi:nickel-dependent lactate racemase